MVLLILYITTPKLDYIILNYFNKVHYDAKKDFTEEQIVVVVSRVTTNVITKFSAKVRFNSGIPPNIHMSLLSAKFS